MNMTTMEVCLCILILAGAFTVITLGIFFLRAAVAIKQIGTTVELGQTTITKIDRIADDVSYKLDLLNMPVESITRFFDPKKPKFDFIGTILKIFKK